MLVNNPKIHNAHTFKNTGITRSNENNERYDGRYHEVEYHEGVVIYRRMSNKNKSLKSLK